MKHVTSTLEVSSTNLSFLNFIIGPTLAIQYKILISCDTIKLTCAKIKKIVSYRTGLDETLAAKQ